MQTGARDEIRIVIVAWFDEYSPAFKVLIKRERKSSQIITPACLCPVAMETAIQHGGLGRCRGCFE